MVWDDYYLKMELKLMPTEILSHILSYLRDRDKLAFLATCQTFWSLRHMSYFTTKMMLVATILRTVSYYDRFINVICNADFTILPIHVQRLRIDLGYPGKRARKYFDWRILQQLPRLQRLEIHNVNTKHGCPLIIPDTVTYLRLNTDILPPYRLSANLRKLVCSEPVLLEIMPQLPTTLVNFKINIINAYADNKQPDTIAKITTALASKLQCLKLVLIKRTNFGTDDVLMPDIDFPKLRKFASDAHLTIRNFNIYALTAIQKLHMPCLKVSGSLPEKLQDLLCDKCCACSLPTLLQKLKCNWLRINTTFHFPYLVTLSVNICHDVLDLKYVPLLQRLRLDGGRLINLDLAMNLQTLILGRVPTPETFPTNLQHLKFASCVVLNSDNLSGLKLTHLVVNGLVGLKKSQHQVFTVPETVTHAKILVEDNTLEVRLPTNLQVLDMSTKLVSSLQKCLTPNLRVIYMRRQILSRMTDALYNLSDEILSESHASSEEIDDSIESTHVSDTDTSINMKAEVERSDDFWVSVSENNKSETPPHLPPISETSDTDDMDLDLYKIMDLDLYKIHGKPFPDLATFVPACVRAIYVDNHIEILNMDGFYDKVRVMPPGFEIIRDDFATENEN